jgi:hypothetical protein
LLALVVGCLLALVVWLVGWLVGCVVGVVSLIWLGWLVVCLLGRLVLGCLVAWLIAWLVGLVLSSFCWFVASFVCRKSTVVPVGSEPAEPNAKRDRIRRLTQYT